jgi:hypothetical protein
VPVADLGKKRGQIKNRSGLFCHNCFLVPACGRISTSGLSFIVSVGTDIAGYLLRNRWRPWLRIAGSRYRQESRLLALPPVHRVWLFTILPLPRLSDFAQSEVRRPKADNCIGIGPHAGVPLHPSICVAKGDECLACLIANGLSGQALVGHGEARGIVTSFCPDRGGSSKRRGSAMRTYLLARQDLRFRSDRARCLCRSSYR